LAAARASPLRWARNRDGSTIVEFAVIFPLLVMFIFGIWYAGYTLFLGSEVRHAVELASRIYITNPASTSTDLSNAVSSHLTDVSIDQVTLAVATQTTDTATSEHITWSYSTTPPIPFMPAVAWTFGGNVDMPIATP
jgi:Flp pilus assembly protein TadG